MKVGPFVLDDAKVAEAKARFEANAVYRRKDKTSFEKYLGLFANDCQSFTAIGKNKPKRRRLSRGMMGMVYKRYFADLFPRRSGGHSRNRFCLLKKVSIRARELPADKCLVREVGEVATQQGFDFKREPYLGMSMTDRDRYFKKKFVQIGNKRCRLYKITKPFFTPETKRFYAHTNIRVNSVRTADFLIIQTKIENYPTQFWIIPVADCLEIFNDKITSGAKSVAFYLPVEKLPVYRNIKPKVDWWKYENAWHLLRGGSETVPPSAIISTQELIQASAS